MLNLTGVTQQPGVALTEAEVVQLHKIQPIPGKDGLFVVAGLDGNVTGGSTAVLVTSEGVIIVDDKLPRHFDHIVEQVKSVTSQPIRYVLNTHHHGDHTGSNAQLMETADTFMHANARANMIRGEQAGPGRITFTDRQSIFLGGFEVRCITSAAAKPMATRSSISPASG
jgi:cyclase